MSILDVNLNNIPEQVVHPMDSEVQLQIAKAAVVEKKSREGTQIAAILSDPAEPNMRDIFHYVTIPTKQLKKEDEKAYWDACRRLKSFYDCFGIAHESGVDIEKDLPGCMGWCILGVEDDLDGVERNRVRRPVIR